MMPQKLPTTNAPLLFLAVLVVLGAAYLPRQSQPVATSAALPGLSARAGSAGTAATPTVQADSNTLPLMNVSTTTSPSTSGWFASSPVVISATAKDAILLQGQVDGGEWQNIESLSVSVDGIHHVFFRAQDKAGDVTTWEMIVPLDTTPPSVTVSVPATRHSNDWHISPLVVSARASDALSGVADKEVSLDGGLTWQPDFSLSDGVYRVQARAFDVAGHVAISSPVTVKVDTTPPSVGFKAVENTLSILAADTTSGIASVKYHLDGGSTWQSGSTAEHSLSLDLADGEHKVDVRATDQAGLVTMTSVAVGVSTTPSSAPRWLLAEHSLSRVLETIFGIFTNRHEIMFYYPVYGVP